MSHRRRLSSRALRRRNPMRGLAPPGPFGDPDAGRPGSCLRCGKAEATRVAGVDGDMEWLAAGLVKIARFPVDEAVKYVEVGWNGTGDLRFNVSAHNDERRRLMLVRMCRSCANDAYGDIGMPFYSLARLNEEGPFEMKIMDQPDDMVDEGVEES